MTITGSVLILGATSDMARAVARAYAAQGCPLILTGRSPQALATQADDIRLRYNIQVDTYVLDVLDTSAHAAFIGALPVLPHTVICAVGMMSDQALCENDPALAETVMRTNYLAPALLFDRFAAAMEVAGRGTLIGISSVAGDRGRASNYCYGAAKAGFSAYLSGLRNRCCKRNVHVITVKPGFVRTRMTQGMDLPGVLTAEPEEIGKAIAHAQLRGRNVIYVRPIWRLIMLIIAHIPEMLFKRLSL